MTAATLPLAQREGFHAPGIEIFEWPDIVHLEVAGIDLSINRVVLQMLFVGLLVWALFRLIEPETNALSRTTMLRRFLVAVLLFVIFLLLGITAAKKLS